MSRKYSISLAKAILASLWYDKYAQVKDLGTHPYIEPLNRRAASFRTALFRLKKANLLKKENNSLKLTEMGERQALFAFIDAETALYKTNFFQKWDGAWRILLFDIPESKRRHRDYLRKILKRIGFKELQRSIWAYPYPVPSFLKELVFHNDICSHARLITTDSIEGDSDLQKLFNLQRE